MAALGPLTIAGYPEGGTLARAGESVDLQVVVKAGGVPISKARVEWSVTSGEGLFKILDLNYPDRLELAGSTTNATGTDGVSQATFFPTVVGSTTVTARATTDGGEAVGSVDFTNASSAVLITISRAHWDAAWPAGPQGVTVPVGTRVDWAESLDDLWSLEERIHSTSVPPGGEGFDITFQLESGEPWSFAPSVPGEWVWELDDGLRVIGSATLTALTAQ